MNNYESLLERISRASGMTKEDIDRKVEAKKAKLSGLISKEGAAQIVAAELGVTFENETLNLSELVHGMKRVNAVGKITKVFPVKEYKKNDREGKIGSFLFGDKSANTRVVLWDVNHIDMLEKGAIAEGDVIEVKNGAVRNGELHLSGFSDIKKSKEKLSDVVSSRSVSAGKLKDAKAGQSMNVRAVIVQTFEPRFFDSKQNVGEKSALLNLVLDDGTETIRAVLFGDNIKKLGLADEEIFSLEKFAMKKQEIVGEEKLFSGNFRMNNFFNIVEMSIDDVKEIDTDSLVKELEARS